MYKKACKTHNFKGEIPILCALTHKLQALHFFVARETCFKINLTNIVFYSS